MAGEKCRGAKAVSAYATDQVGEEADEWAEIGTWVRRGRWSPKRPGRTATTRTRSRYATAETGARRRSRACSRLRGPGKVPRIFARFVVFLVIFALLMGLSILFGLIQID